MTGLKYFGTSGIRGRTLIDITPIFAHKMAFAFATFLGNKGKVVIGRDTRFGAELLENSVITGLIAGGMDVYTTGIIPTPGLCERSKELNAKAAVMITGSHIPPDRIGLIWQFGDGSYIDDLSAIEIEKIYDKLDENIDYVQLENIGYIREDKYAIEEYLETIQNYIPIKEIKRSKFKIVLDNANGTAAYIATKLLQKYGCEVIAINDIHSPECSRISEPVESNLKDLMQIVDETNADLGVAFDIDTDRSTFIANINGKVNLISPNIIGTLLMEEIIKKNPGTVVLPVNTSGLASEVLNEYKLNPIFCKIGQPATIEMCKKFNAVFSFEESGKFYHLEYGTLWTDALVNVLKILELMSSTKNSLKELIKRYTLYYGGTTSIKAKYDSFREMMPKVYEMLKKIKTEVPITEEIKIDGYRINFKDNSWLLVRPSGTEPKIRIVADAKSKERANYLTSAAKKTIISVIGEENLLK